VTPKPKRKSSQASPHHHPEKFLITGRGAEQAANDHYCASATSAANTRAYQAAITAGLSSSEREDLFQEVMLDLWERRQRFDPAKGAPGTFTGLVSAHRTAEFLNARKVDRSRLVLSDAEDVDTRAVVAIDRVVHGFVLGSKAANDDFADEPSMAIGGVLDGWWGQDRDLFSDSDALHDLGVAIAYMTAEQAALFDLLETHLDLPSACQASGMSSAAFYRRVADLQMHLRMFGFKASA
jgi:DNA-directed RNA polymerase specialized sigma24 family protein